MEDKRNLRRIRITITAQTLWHLQKEAIRKRTSIGKIVDGLVRESRKKVGTQ